MLLPDFSHTSGSWAMSKWKRVRYGRVTSNVRARAESDTAELLSVTARQGVIRQSQSGRRDVSAMDKSKYLVVEPGDVVYNTMRMWQGVSGFSEMSGVVSPAYTVLRPAPEELDGRFLAHLMKVPCNIRQYRANSQGLVSDTWNLKFGTLANLRLDIPPLEEQRRIAEILDTIDQTIHTTERVITKMWAVRQSIVEDLLGAVDREFKSVPLFDVVSLPVGQVDPRTEPYASMALVAPDHLQPMGRGRLIARVSAKDQNAVSGKYRFRAGDVIYSKIRPELRKAWLATFDGLCSADMYPLGPGPELLGGYLASVMLGQRFARFAVSVSGRSSGMPKNNRQELGEFQIAIPSKEVQKTIARIMRSLDHRIDSEIAILEKVQTSRVGLAADLLSGKVRTVAA